MRTLLVFVSLVLVPHAFAAETAQPVAGRVKLARGWHFRPVHAVAREIVARFPPEHYHYIGVGRGPTPFMAMLQAMLGTEAATNMPLSYLRNLQPAKQKVIDAPQNYSELEVKREHTRAGTYTTKVLARFHNHLRQFLPKPGDPEGGKIQLFIDYADSGVSLINLKREMDLYTESLPADRKRRYAYLGLTHAFNGVAERLTGFGIETIELKGRALYIVDAHLFKHLAEYSFWSVSAPVNPIPEPNTRAAKRKVLRQEVVPEMNLRQRHDRDVRDLRKRVIKAYREAEDFYDLRNAYVARLGEVPAGAVVARCAAWLDRAVDSVYQVRFRK